MPRVTRTQQHENLGVSTANNAAVNKKKLQLGLGLQQIGGGNENMAILAAQNGKRKNAGNSIDKMPSKRRAALGEITNAFAETTTQARKGLSKMMSKGSLKATKSSSQPSSTETTAKPKKAAPIKKPPRAGRPNTRRSKDSISTESKSLPCTQEEASTLVLTGARETFAPIDLSDDEDSVSVYESADDGDDEAEDDDHHDGRGDEQKAVLPDGVTDFDGENVNDPNQVSEYAMEVFQYYKDREAQFRVPDYMKVVQNEVTPHMRAVLVDWLVEVQESFELNHETLYTAVKMLDLYLSQVRVHKEDLQLIGATACLIASKIDERLPPTLSDFVYVCDDAYNETDLKRKEIEMIRVVDFDVGYPLSYRFFRRYARVSGFAMPTMTFGRYMLELALMDYTLNVDTSESKLAAAAVVVTAKVHGLPEESWRSNLEHFSGYKIEECLPQIQKLHALVLKPSSVSSTRKTIRTKYSHAVFHSVAQKQIPVHISL